MVVVVVVEDDDSAEVFPLPLSYEGCPNVNGPSSGSSPAYMWFVLLV